MSLQTRHAAPCSHALQAKARSAATDPLGIASIPIPAEALGEALLPLDSDSKPT